MKKFQPIIFLLVVFSSSKLFAQETELPLGMNPEQAIQHQKEKSFVPRMRGGGSLSLPFFDDFSRYSLPTSDPDIPTAWQRWEENDVFINGTFPVSPPTIGVATFDGLNSTGYPYDFSQTDAYGPADKLTSLPIDLSSYTEEDNVQLMFFYEPEGMGNFPDPEDSLVVEFYSPFGEGQWFHKWSVPGSEVIAFQHVAIPITETVFLMDGFRVRFSNYATLSCNCDHWHIDYVLIESNFDYVECEVDELAMQFPNNTLLQDYTAMPWTHFLTNPAAFMANDFTSYERNLGPTENIVTGYSVVCHDADTDLHEDFPNVDINPSGNGCSEIQRTIPLSGFVYEETVDDTAAIFDVSTYVITTDATPQNDTARFRQVFQNYYAYDDGTAERAYAVNVAGGKVAVKYFCETPDTLLGLFMHWIPFQTDNSGATFLLRVWGNDGGEPGDEIIENFNFHNPHYFHDGHNIFSYYEYDEPVPIDGTFYVGWVQDSNAELNIGNDKNTNSNPQKLFYQLGAGAQWQQSTISGSLMIRPVFKAGLSSVWNGIENTQQIAAEIFPNPAQEFLNIKISDDDCSFEIFEMCGKMIMKDMLVQGLNTIDTSRLSPSVYVLKIAGPGGYRVLLKFIRQ